MKTDLKSLLSTMSQVRLRCQLCFALAAWLVSFGVSASSALVVAEAKLKAKPDFSAVDVKTLQTGDSVEIIQRERGWYQVKQAGNTSGWLTLLQVRFQSEGQASGKGSLSKVLGLRHGHSDVTATTGVRGIGENDIKNAQPDFVALDKAKQFKSSEKEAGQFAKAEKLVAQHIDYEGSKQ